jgi:2-polyprenyl-3-methyl-5-hydroxy-6-metoxy-1,4-benzoquinol methylase
VEQLIKREKCAVCGSVDSVNYLTCNDFLVTKNDFDINKCQSCGFVWTYNVPAEDKIGEYYKSDAYISHTSTKKSLFHYIYHIVRKGALKRKVNLCKRFVSKDAIADVGAGTGSFVKEGLKRGLNIKGFEPDADAREVCKEINNITLNELDSFEKLDNGSLGLVTMWHVLEHVYNLSEYLTVLSKKLKDGGTVLIAVPNHESFDAKHYGCNWAAYDVPRHLYHFSPKTISDLFNQFGFGLDEIIPMKYDSFYVSMMSEENMGNLKWKGVLTGLKSNLKAKTGTWSSQIYVFQKQKTK